MMEQNIEKKKLVECLRFRRNALPVFFVNCKIMDEFCFLFPEILFPHKEE